jgi:hypothetical protein
VVVCESVYLTLLSVRESVREAVREAVHEPCQNCVREVCVRVCP